jgi:actin-related protein
VDFIQFLTSTAVLNTIASLAAATTAVFAYLSIRSSKTIYSAQVIDNFLIKYACQDMKESLRILRNLKENDPDEYDLKWIKSLRNGEKEADIADEARRMVSHYFFRAIKIYQSRAMSKKALRTIIQVDGVELYFNIVEKMEKRLNEDYNRQVFMDIRSALDPKWIMKSSVTLIPPEKI